MNESLAIDPCPHKKLKQEQNDSYLQIEDNE